MTRYTCKQCGKDVPIKDGAPVRPCGCDAPVIAHLSAVARGESAMANGK